MNNGDVATSTYLNTWLNTSTISFSAGTVVLGNSTGSAGAWEEISMSTLATMLGSPEFTGLGLGVAAAGSALITSITGSQQGVLFNTQTASTSTEQVNLLDISTIWNSSGYSPTALKINVTDTASASTSLLFDFQTNGASVSNLRKDGLFSAVNGAFFSASQNFVFVGTNPSTNVSLSFDGSNGLLGTFGGTGSIIYTAANHQFNSTSLVTAFQVASSGNVRVGGGTDDGINNFQVLGSVAYNRMVCGLTTISYASTVTLNFAAGNDYATIAVTGALTLATTGLAQIRGKTVVLVADTSNHALTFPAGWVFVGGAAPTVLLANKTAILSLTSFGTADSSVVAAYAVQP